MTNKTSRTRQLEKDNRQDKPGGQDIKDKTDRSAWKGQPGQNREERADMTART
jgi:acyl-CoA-binding protein